MKTRLRGFVYCIFLSKFDSFWFCIAWHSRVTAKPHRVVVGWKSVEDITTSKFIYIDTVSIYQPAKLFSIFIHFFLSLFVFLFIQYLIPLSLLLSKLRDFFPFYYFICSKNWNKGPANPRWQSNPKVMSHPERSDR